MYERDEDLPLGPEQIRSQLYAFWKEIIGRPVAVVGASLGGTTALDFVKHHSEVRLASKHHKAL
jgi:alpha-beta hydrolase superfamily lysophospholipase